MFCKYRDIFGKPKKGLHNIRIMDIAIIDLILTFIFALFISNKYNLNIWGIFILLIIFSIFIHKLFCVNTKLVSLFDSLFIC